MTLEVADSDFEKEVLERSENTPVVVDLWAPWCGPCKSLGPILERVIEETNGKVVLAKVNIDENPMTPSKYGVRGIPTLMLFKDGEVASTKVGALPKGKLVEWIRSSV